MAQDKLEEWFFSNRPKDGEFGDKIFDEWVEHCKSYGLMNEVMEWTKIYHDKEYEFMEAFDMAMFEWDL